MKCGKALSVYFCVSIIQLDLGRGSSSLRGGLSLAKKKFELDDVREKAVPGEMHFSPGFSFSSRFGRCPVNEMTENA